MDRATVPTNRIQISLDGAWSFRHENGPERIATVPLPWQAQFADLRHSSGRATYRRSFALPDLQGRAAFLCFGAVSYHAQVRVNGTLVSSHEGGFLPFECPLPASLLKPENVVEVDCLLPGGDAASSTDYPFPEIPHGKQSWYGPVGGIWQSVTLDLRAPVHLTHCAITADISGKVQVKLTQSAQAPAKLTILAPDGSTVASTTTDTGAANLTVANPALWSPDHPNLYRLQVDLPGDSTTHSFGFRHFETREGRFYLNGEPYYMRAALDQDYYPEGISTPPSVEFLEDQLKKAKELGLNMLRCHIKVPDPRYYEVADRLGMLIWTEIPNVAILTDASARRLRETMEGILQRDGNHPSIVIWTIINEDWGTRTCEDPAHRRWLADTFDWLKALDPTRLVVDNSPCHGNFHVKTDINDYHYYRSVPERREEWDALTAEFAAGADWTFTPYGDGQRRGDEPLVVSEFGVWGLPNPAQVTINGQEPWWMGTGGTWGDGAAYPHGIQDRFATLGLATVFGSFDKFIDAAQWYQFANLKYEIEVMRAYPSIQGYVITEFTDVHWESNGLLDMNRNPRAFHSRFAEVNTDVVILALPPHYAAWLGQDFALPVSVATGGLAVASPVLHWSTSEGHKGQIALPDLAAQSVTAAAPLHLALKGQGAHRMMVVSFDLQSGGQSIARNQVEIALYSKDLPKGLPTVGSADVALLAYAAGLGLPTTSINKADVILARALDPADIAALQSGRRYLLIAGEHPDYPNKIRTDKPRREQPFIKIVDDDLGNPGNLDGLLPNIGLQARQGTMWRGDWIAGFSWIRREGVFADMPGGPLVDVSFSSVIPRHVLTGFRTWEFAGAVHSGVVVGWAQKPAAFIAERRVGRGGLVASTFRLTNDPAGADPVAAYLMTALIRLAGQTATDIPGGK